MAHCPNCKRKLKLTDISQNCPGCGVNMRFFGFEDRFRADAKRSELSMAKAQVLIRTLKAAFIGGKLPVIRLCTVFLPVLTLLLPGGEAWIPLPFGAERLHIYNLFASVAAGENPIGHSVLFVLPSMLGTQANGKAVGWLLGAALCFALTALCAVVVILITILAFINLRRSAKANCAVSAAGILLQLAQAGCTLCCGVAGTPVNAKLSFGWVVVIAAFAVCFAVNLLIARRGIPVELDEGTEERVRIARQIRRKQIMLSDLPQPIVETAQTRLLREQIKKEKETQVSLAAEKEA